jgi:DNA-binding protein Fis
MTMLLKKEENGQVSCVYKYLHEGQTRAIVTLGDSHREAMDKAIKKFEETKNARQ